MVTKTKIETPSTVASQHTVNSDTGSFLLNPRILGIIGVVLLAIVGGVFLYISNQASKNDRALIEVGRIRPYYDRSEWTVAINGDSSRTIGGEKIRGLRAIVDDYSSVPAGKIAALLLGNAYLSTAQNEKARQAYEIAIEANADLVVAAAYSRLAEVAESAGKFEEAANEYVKASSAEPTEITKARYLLGAARNFERANKIDEAIKHYRTIATKYPQATEESAQALLALARNNVQL